MLITQWPDERLSEAEARWLLAVREHAGSSATLQIVHVMDKLQSFRLPAHSRHRLWRMLAHWHGQLWNASILAQDLHSSPQSFV
jgi:hypothetical protein